MRFNKISFKNYRCFLNGTVAFKETQNKNVNLLIGPNGGGKTEILFAFWWALYGFDFSSLRAKEHTPYALNCDLYKELQEAEEGTEKSCSVTLEIEHEGTTYIVTKRCDYRKTERKIKEDEYQELCCYLPNGELSLPERNSDNIKKHLNRIIPKSILYGIVFDGERMQKLASTDEAAKNAISGVISDITNVELI